MYNKIVVDKLVNYIKAQNGIGDKNKLRDIVQKEFCLVKDGSVYYNDDFAIRFGWNGKNNSKRVSNTVLGLSRVKSYDDRPLIFCIATHEENHMMLINSTFLKKVSHSSRDLRMDNIRGSINCGDIMMDFEGCENCPDNFESMFAYHTGLTFEDNLERLVESTNNIVGRVKKFDVTADREARIIASIARAVDFSVSDEYDDLKGDLDKRVSLVQGEIAIAAFIDNVNLRGRIIEYLITDNGSSLKDQIISSLHNGTPLPTFRTDDKLGDYSKSYSKYDTETDIKTKVLFLDGNPKAYNIDKLLEFLSEEKSVYMIYLLGIDDKGAIVARLCSALDERLIESTNVIHHWAGRNSRGVAQFIGHGLTRILNEENKPMIDTCQAEEYLYSLIRK